MGKKIKAGKTYDAATFMSRARAIKKLGIPIYEFRTLCVLKGVYPREPKKKTHHGNKTMYLTKDIRFMLHDPLIEKFRQKHLIKRKIVKAKHKKDPAKVKSLQKSLPAITIDHIIKERYPTFSDALHEMDDALCMLFLFANQAQVESVTTPRIQVSARLCQEWMAYCAATHRLKKVFVSIKGYYYQVVIGQSKITWLVPHKFNVEPSDQVDYSLMGTFLDLHIQLVQYVLFKLYTKEGLRYPPIETALSKKMDALPENSNTFDNLDAVLKLLLPDNSQLDKLATKETKKIQKTEARIKTLDSKALLKIEEQKQEEKPSEEEEDLDEDEQAVDEQIKTTDEKEDKDFLENQANADNATNYHATLFKGLKFFLNREINRDSLEFVIRACGGLVSWDTPDNSSPYPKDDENITHEIIDRPGTQVKYPNREYVQPQWIYDSVNEFMLLPVTEYLPGETLPPHLSPFVIDHQQNYIPERRVYLDSINPNKRIKTQLKTFEETKTLNEEELDEREHKETARAMLSSAKRRRYDKLVKKKKIVKDKGKELAKKHKAIELKKNLS